MVLFVVEIVKKRKAKEYNSEFAYLLDIFACITYGFDLYSIIFETNNRCNSLTAIRAARFARLGAQIYSLIRFMRHKRRIKMVKLYKSATEADGHRDPGQLDKKEKPEGLIKRFDNLRKQKTDENADNFEK